MSFDEKKQKECMLDDECMEKVTGGTEELTFDDFFESEDFDKTLVNNARGK